MSLSKKASPLEYVRSDADKWVDFMNQSHWNVMESSYGATGLDTGNDGTAIQAAINAAQVTGGIVYMPPGRYRITTPLTIAKGVTLRGAGWAGGSRGTYLHVVNNASTVSYTH